LDAIALIFSKFSEELMGAEVALICAVVAIAIYWTLIRKKKRESAEWVPAALVRAYLDKVRTDEADIRYRLFGEQPAMTGSVAPTIINSSDPALGRELEALRSQLSLADQRALDFDRMLNGLRAEKSALEQKLAAVPAATASGAGGPPAGMVKELDDLKAKLQEYEVIEDDLANLKKFQKENEVLRVKVEQFEKGGATVVAGGTAAPVAEVKISGGAPQQPAELRIVPGAAPAAEAPKAPETNTNVLAPVTPSAEAAPAAAPAAVAAPAPVAAVAAAPAADKSPKEKEAELLSEFEKMLAS
jgi:hypothetical protein